MVIYKKQEPLEAELMSRMKNDLISFHKEIPAEIISSSMKSGMNAYPGHNTSIVLPIFGPPHCLLEYNARVLRTFNYNARLLISILLQDTESRTFLPMCCSNQRECKLRSQTTMRTKSDMSR